MEHIHVNTFRGEKQGVLELNRLVRLFTIRLWRL